MRQKSLAPNQFLEFGFRPLVADPRVTFQVWADGPVTTYLVDDMGLEDYVNGNPPNSFASFSNRRNHQAELTLPNFNRYHLVIANNSPDSPVRIEYDIKVR